MNDLEKLTSAIESIEHPEIACNLRELGMIGTIEIDKATAKVELKLPMITIDAAIKKMLTTSIEDVISKFHLEPSISLSEMETSQRERFFELAKQNWKHK